MTTKTTPTWFITGASSGFGMAFARYALDRGYNVVATARSVGKLEALAASAPDRVLVHKLDVTVPTDAEAAIAAAVRRFGRIDVLINNAGYGTMGAVEETPDAEFRAQMETNFFGALSVTQGRAAVSPAAARRRHRQHVEQRRADVVSRRRVLLRVEVRARGDVGGAGAGGCAVRHQGADRRTRRVPHRFWRRCPEVHADDGRIPRHRRPHARLHTQDGWHAAR